MSWSGTVTCSYCYKQGHNKRKCPELTEAIKNQYIGHTLNAKQSREAGKINDAEWYESRAELKRQEYMKRTKIDLATGEKVSNKAAKAARMKKVQCGYCGKRGHTRRTCPTVKVDKQVFVEETRRVRIAAFEKAANMGIGMGSMLPIRSTGYDVDGTWRRDILTLRYIKSIEWDSCHANRPNLTVKHVDARKLGSSEQYRWTSQDQIEKLVQANNTALRYADAEGGELPPSSLIPTLDPPKGWLQPTEQSLELAIKQTFPTQGTKHAKQRAWEYEYPSGITREIIKDLGLTEHFDHINCS